VFQISNDPCTMGATRRMHPTGPQRAEASLREAKSPRETVTSASAYSMSPSAIVRGSNVASSLRVKHIAFDSFQRAYSSWICPRSLRRITWRHAEPVPAIGRGKPFALCSSGVLSERHPRSARLSQLGVFPPRRRVGRQEPHQVHVVEVGSEALMSCSKAELVDRLCLSTQKMAEYEVACRRATRPRRSAC
jgi:hypothetical protein